ncbi:MAG: PcfJ domain-containing protein [Pseudomonadota bacterium]
MARRPLHLQNLDPVPKPIEQHMLHLGFVHSRHYFAWCAANGFRADAIKSRTDLQEERDAFDALARKREAQNRLHKKPRAFFEAVARGEVTSDEIARPSFRMAASEIEASNEAREARDSLVDMLSAVTKIDDMAFHSHAKDENWPFIRGLIKLHDRKALWLRPLEEWRPRSKNREKRFGELARHLLDEYGDTPRFMEQAWLRDDRGSWRFRDWYVHLGRGRNLRTAKSPVPITKKIAHHFLQAPDDYEIEQAIRWGQLKALGASESAIHAVAATEVGRSFEHEEFWSSVFRFIADNPMLDPRQIGPVIDYLQNQKYVAEEVEIAPGLWRRGEPPQPGLTMRGRTVETLMRQVADWHESLGRAGRMSDARYDAAGYEGLEISKRSGGRSIKWTIRQLRSARELQLESQDLRHCVASYHWSCSRGLCTIWSLSSSDADGAYKRRQTIEVNRNKTIVQCRGLANRDPSPEEWSIVNAWASQAGLTISSFF